MLKQYTDKARGIDVLLYCCIFCGVGPAPPASPTTETVRKAKKLFIKTRVRFEVSGVCPARKNRSEYTIYRNVKYIFDFSRFRKSLNEVVAQYLIRTK